MENNIEKLYPEIYMFKSLSDRSLDIINNNFKKINEIDSILNTIENDATITSICNTLLILKSDLSRISIELFSLIKSYIDNLYTIYNIMYVYTLSSFSPSVNPLFKKIIMESFQSIINVLSNIDELFKYTKQRNDLIPETLVDYYNSFISLATKLGLDISKFSDNKIITTEISDVYNYLLESSNNIIIFSDYLQQSNNVQTKLKSLLKKYNCEEKLQEIDYELCTNLYYKHAIIKDNLYDLRTKINNTEIQLQKELDTNKKLTLSNELQKYKSSFSSLVFEINTLIESINSLCKYIEMSSGYYELDNLTKYVVFNRYDPRITGLNKIIGILYDENKNEIGYIDAPKISKDFYSGSWTTNINGDIQSGNISLNFSSPNILVGDYTSPDSNINIPIKGLRKWDDMYIDSRLTF